MASAPRYAFGDFVLERSRQQVRRSDGSPLDLSPRLFNALLLFVENAGEVLDKDALMLALWPGLVVDENSLSQVIYGLRRALADDTRHSQYIQTLHRRGFRFIAPVDVLPDQASPARSFMADDAAAARQPEPVPLPGAAQPDVADGRSASAAWRLLGLGLAAGVVTGFVGTGWWTWRNESTSRAAHLSTLAVLPFKPLVTEGRDELLEVGMADSLIAHLSTVPGLVVRSVGSVRRYAGAEQDPLRAARELDVAWIVDGSLQRRGDQLRVTARLLHAADGSAAWSGSFDENLAGVFDVQDAISARVARMLVPNLDADAGARQPLAALGGTRNTDAYQLYLAAARQAQSMRADGLRKGIALYHQALAVDPDYALAWAGLAEAHRRTLFGSDGEPSEVFEAASMAVRRALAVAPNLAEARTEQAFKLYYFDFDWAAAEREFRRAEAINPNLAFPHFGRAMLMLTQDRPDEGFAQIRTARELDPMSPVFNTLEASYLLEAGRRDDARIRLKRAFDIAPDYWLVHATLALLRLGEQQPEQAIDALRHAVTLADGNSRASALLAVHLAKLGQTEEARRILNGLLSRAEMRYVPPASIAAVHAALGEASAALDALDRAFVAHDTQLTIVKDDPRFAGLHNEPRFVALMKKLRLDRFGRGLSPP